MAKKNPRDQIALAFDEALRRASEDFTQGIVPDYGLSTPLLNALGVLSEFAAKASTGFTNIMTSLAVKAAYPDVDIRYHQTQIQKDTERPAGFSFRPISEKVVYPLLDAQKFEGAKSGWQTRTFERPKPYKLDYDENIDDIKGPFLTVFDEIEEKGESGADALAYIIYLQLVSRESKKITLAVPKTQDISLIVALFREHFFYSYQHSKGASRLPVLALYSIYQVLIEQVERYRGTVLKPLQEHSAADSQTGSIGDIEIVDTVSHEVFEAVEVKHDILLSEQIISNVGAKIMNKSVKRYYILTTHPYCEPSEDLLPTIYQISRMHNCQLIANGVIPSIKYYLRLMSDPSKVFPFYVNLLADDKAIKYEHKEVWNLLTTNPTNPKFKR